MAKEFFTQEQAETDLFHTGPGGFCEDCGHPAFRHKGSSCNFPSPEDNACGCGGMLWLGQRVNMEKMLEQAGVAYKNPSKR